MRFWILLVLVVVLVDTSTLLAQDIEQHCIDLTAPPVELSDITINGTLFVSSEDGTRAIRNPIPTPYVIAFSDHYRVFGSIGSFSPDGRWFSYFSGTSSRMNWVDREYRLKQMNFVDTYTGQHIFSVPVEGFVLFISGSRPLTVWRTTGWLDSNTKTYINNSRLDLPDEIMLINTETQSTEMHPSEEVITGISSPDGKYTITDEGIINRNTGEIFLESGDRISWLQDGSGYYIQTATGISIYDMDGTLRFSHESGYSSHVSQTGKYLASSPNIINTETGDVTDLCTRLYSIMFSPDDTQAAIMLQVEDQYQLWFMDTETWQATHVNIQFSGYNNLVGWWNIEPSK